MDLVIDGVRWVLWILVKGSMFLIDSVYNIIRPILSFDIGSNSTVWQWWDILNYSTALELDELKEITPLIQSIDSYETNQKLGISFEAKVGKGKLFVLCADPEKKIDERPAMQQLLTSVRNYVSSGHFNPTKSLPSTCWMHFSPRHPKRNPETRVARRSNCY